MKTETRMPKSETNPKAEARSPKSGAVGTSVFGIRTSGFIRISDFELRILPNSAMKRSTITLLLAALLATPSLALAGFTLTEMSPQSKACAECHKKESQALYQQWGSSKHYL